MISLARPLPCIPRAHTIADIVCAQQRLALLSLLQPGAESNGGEGGNGVAGIAQCELEHDLLLVAVTPSVLRQSVTASGVTVLGAPSACSG